MNTDVSYNNLIQTVTDEFISNLDLDNLPEPDKIEEKLLSELKSHIELRNMTVAGNSKWAIPKTLPFTVIADLMIALNNVYSVTANTKNYNRDYDVVAVYQTDGSNKGIYSSSESDIRAIARTYNNSITTKEFEEVIAAVKDKAPRKSRCIKPNLIPVNNGIFDYDTKTLMPFTPDIVFFSKSHIDYVPNAANPIIHDDNDNTDWDVESWMNNLSDDKEIVNLLWEILGAIIRPNVRWNKSAWLYSETGNNGKGTLCQLMRNLCGEGSYASIPLNDFSTDFMLEPLIRTSAIIVDENDVGIYIDKAANLKAVVTNDVITINRKYKTPVPYQFFGFMVQCLNEFPRIKDKSGSFYRRQLFIPFEKCFTGTEKPYIKSDYLYRTEVLEYVLCKVLNTNYYTLSEPQACKNVLEEYKYYNDPLRQFFDEIVETECVWDLLPFSFLYSLYRAWFRENIPQGAALGRNTFIREICVIANESGTWRCENKNKKVWTQNHMDKTEYLIQKYNLTEWMNPYYTGNDIKRICHPDLADNYRGLERIIPQTISTTIN